MTVNANVDGDRAIKRLRRLEDEMSEELDDAAEEVAWKGVDGARKALLRQGSVATETGINSLDVHQFEKHHYATIGRKYLELVHRGSEPHTPDINARLIVWATQEGWRVDDLVDHIEEEGTKPHPWMDTAFDPIVKTIPERVAAQVRRNVNF